MWAHTCRLSTWEAETGFPVLAGQPDLPNRPVRSPASQTPLEADLCILPHVHPTYKQTHMYIHIPSRLSIAGTMMNKANDARTKPVLSHGEAEGDTSMSFHIRQCKIYWRGSCMFIHTAPHVHLQEHTHTHFHRIAIGSYICYEYIRSEGQRLAWVKRPCDFTSRLRT